MKRFYCLNHWIVLVLFAVVAMGSWAQTSSSKGKSSSLTEINKSLVEQNQILAAQNQALADYNRALAEQIDAYDKRVSALEEKLADSRAGKASADFWSALPLWAILLLVGAVVVSLLSLLYICARARRLQKRMDDCESKYRLLSNDRQRIDRVREELERKISAKEHQLRSEVSAMSLAITAVRDANEAKHASDGRGQMEAHALTGGEVVFLDGEGEAEAASEEEKPKITGDQCFMALPTLFIRNEQRLLAVDGGVSITTANKWLDAWEQNGWVEKVSRGKYMKTLKGKKISLNIRK